MTWKNANDRLPSSGQKIKAVILYQGREHEVEGAAMANPAYVIFDFWNSVGAEKILRWSEI